MRPDLRNKLAALPEWAHELKALGQRDGRSVAEAVAEADQIMSRAAHAGDKLFVDASCLGVNSVPDNGPPNKSKEAPTQNIHYMQQLVSDKIADKMNKAIN